MNSQEAIAAVYQGHMFDCTFEGYKADVRTALQNQAGKWIDDGDNVRAMIALEEVKRLDIKFKTVIY